MRNKLWAVVQKSIENKLWILQFVTSL